MGKKYTLLTQMTFTIVTSLLITVTCYSASPLSWSQMLKETFNIYENSSKIIDWLYWSQEAASRIQQGKAPLPTPFTPNVLKEFIEKQETSISQITIPKYDKSLPSTKPVPTGSFDATRNEIRSRISVLQDCVSELQESSSSIKQLRNLEKLLQTQLKRFSKLEEVLIELMVTVNPPSILNEHFGFAAIDANYFAKSTIETLGKVESKGKKASLEFTNRKNQLKVSTQDIRNFLVVEAIDLKIQAERLQSLDSEIQTLQEKFVNLVEIKNLTERDVKLKDAYYKAALLDYQNHEDLIDTKKGEINDLNRKIEQKVSVLDRMKFKCPNEQPENLCTHYELKNQFKNDKNQLHSEIKSLNNRLKDLNKTLTYLNNDLIRFKSNLEIAKNAYELTRRKLLNDIANVENAKKDLVEKVKYTNEEKWKSRADVFLSDNANDQRLTDKINKELEFE